MWAQPVKALAGYRFEVDLGGETWALDAAESFTQAMDSVRFTFRSDGIRAERTDTAALDLPLLLTTITLVREHGPAVEVTVRFVAQFDLQDAWFTSLGDRRNAGQHVAAEHGRLVARAEVAPERWAVAIGGATPPERADTDSTTTGCLSHRVRLEPGEPSGLAFGVAVSSSGGSVEALALLDRGLASPGRIGAAKVARFEDLAARAPRLETPDAELDAAFALAVANLALLEAEPAGLGRCCYAGLEMFPFWFSGDTAYSMSGLMIAGLCDTAAAQVRLGARYLGAGGVPHQLSPAGHVVFDGRTAETPLWVMAVRDAYRWTGDRQLIRELFPAAWTAMFDVVLGALDPDGDGYPSGPGMVEVEGLGAEALDSAAYTWAALRALAELADALGDHQRASMATRRAEQIASRFCADWWDEPSSGFAMSLTEPDNSRQVVPHWAVVTPLEVGLADPGRASAALATIQREHLNRWGLRHTVGADDRVWTLPTAALSRAAYRYGDPAMGLAMLRHLAETLQHGPIGLFHELIPEGACIVQLWSAATFLRGVVEDLLGIEVRAAQHTIRVRSRLPFEWDRAALRNLRFGDHTVSILIEHGNVRVERHEGPELQVTTSQGATVGPA